MEILQKVNYKVNYYGHITSFLQWRNEEIWNQTKFKLKLIKIKGRAKMVNIKLKLQMAEINEN